MESLLVYSINEPDIFKFHGLKPIKNLKLLIKDRPVRRRRANPALKR